MARKPANHLRRKRLTEMHKSHARKTVVNFSGRATEHLSECGERPCLLLQGKTDAVKTAEVHQADGHRPQGPDLTVAAPFMEFDALTKIHPEKKRLGIVNPGLKKRTMKTGFADEAQISAETAPCVYKPSGHNG